MGTTVLVVEDDLEINELLGEYLALENMRYVKAVTGGEGIHLAGAEHPDAIILDLMLPDIDGFEVARKLTSQRSTFDIPIIILSCMCQEQDKEKGFQNGAIFFMNKPFLPDDLLATVRQALGWRAALLTRVPAGTLWLGTGERVACAKGFHQMTADLLSRTDLDEPVIAQMRSAVELLATWAGEWKAQHPSAGRLRVDYDIADAAVTWRLSEEVPGLLADAFFKAAKPKAGISLMGWGGRTAKSAPAQGETVPATWMEILTLTGAACFEREAGNQSIRFSRSLAKGLNLVSPTVGSVPVVETASDPKPTEPALQPAANSR